LFAGENVFFLWILSRFRTFYIVNIARFTVNRTKRLEIARKMLYDEHTHSSLYTSMALLIISKATHIASTKLGSARQSLKAEELRSIFGLMTLC
jgi:hypothetical protein